MKPIRSLLFGLARPSVPAPRPSSLLEALEPRTLFSGAPIEPDPAPEAPESAHEAPAALPVAETTPQTPAADDVATTAAELVFVSADVADPEALIAGIGDSLADDRSIAFIRIDAGDDAFARMTDILSQRTDLTAIHILSHGVEGGFGIGGQWLTMGNIEDHSEALAIWGGALRPDGDILIYGCDVADGPTGESFVEALARYTGADIAASDDATGAASLGGNWILERSAGDIDATALALAAAAEWSHLLAAPTVTATHSPVFYTDFSEGLNSSYVAYQITNPGPAAINDAHITIGSFSGGSLALATHEDGLVRLGSIAAGETKTAYFYLTAGSNTATDQQLTVTVYEGLPAGGVVLSSFTDTLTSVEDAGFNRSNKIETVVATDNPATVGSLMTITVTGNTGTIGNARLLAFSPATYGDWRADAFEMVSSTITLTGGNNVVLEDTLFHIAASKSDTDYVAVYTLRIADATITDTTVSPLAYISSGANVSHTDTGTFASFPPILPPTNATTLSLSVDDDSLEGAGTVTYTITLTNAGLTDVTLDRLIANLATTPAAASFVPLSTQFNGAPISDPAISGSTIEWYGTFSVRAGSTATLTFRAAIPGTDGTYTSTAYGLAGGAAIDTTLAFAPADASRPDAAASVNVTVNTTPPPPVRPTVTLSDASATEGGSLTFTATLDQAVAGGFTVEVVTAGGSAQSGIDFSALTRTLSFAGLAGETVTFTVASLQDSLIEEGETFTVSMRNASDATIAITDTGTGRISDNDARLDPTGPGTGITTDVELVANATGGFDLIIEDVETDSPIGFASEMPEGDSRDNLQIYRLGADYVIRDLDGHWLGSPIVGATRVGTSEIRVPAALVTGSIIIRTGIEDDTVTIGDLGASLAGGLLVNTEDPAGAANDFDTITYSAQLSLGAGFDATFAADTITARADARLAATGGGTITWTAGRNILMSGRSSLSTQSGDITLRANLDDSADGNFAGIWLSGATLASASGDLALTGRGGDTGHYNDGIRIGTDKATGATASLTTGGAIDLVGTGGTAGSQGAGIYLLATALSTTGTDAGSRITLQGTGGTIGGYAHGVRLLGGTIQTAAGGIDLDGQAGGSGTTSSNQGVTLSGGARIQAGGSGNLTVSGTGGGSLGGLNAGVVLIDAHLAVADGDLALDGSGGAGAAAKNSQNRGIATERASLRSTGSGDIRLVGTGDGGGTKSAGITLVATSVAASGTGDIALSGTGARNGQTLNHGITLATATLQTASGDLQLSGQGGGILRKNNGIDISAKSQLTAGGSGSLQLDGTAGRGDSDNLGVFVATSQLTTAHGDLVLTGTGSGSLDRNRGVALAKSTLRVTGSGDLAVTGTGSTSAAGKNNEGVTIATSTLRTLGTGSLTIHGHGGTGRGFNHGVSILSSALTASDGPLAITGRAAATATGVYNTGLSIQQKSTLGAGGLLSLTGTGGGGSGYNHGLLINNRVTALGALTSGTAGSGATSLDTAGDYFARR